MVRNDPLEESKVIWNRKRNTLGEIYGMVGFGPIHCFIF